MGRKKKIIRATDDMQEQIEQIIGEENVLRVSENQVAVRIKTPQRDRPSDQEVFSALVAMQSDRENFWYAVLFELAMFRQALQDEEELGEARNMLNDLNKQNEE